MASPAIPLSCRRPKKDEVRSSDFLQEVRTMSRWLLFAVALSLALIVGCNRPALPPAQKETPANPAKAEPPPEPEPRKQLVPHKVEKPAEPRPGEPFVRVSKEQPGLLSGYVVWEG